MTIHFVYATTTEGQSTSRRLWAKMSRLAQSCGVPFPYFHDRKHPDFSDWPFRSPFSITQHIFKALSRLAPVRLYDWKEQGVISPDPGDILIGHAHPGGDSHIWNRSCLRGGFKACFALQPVCWGMPEYCWFIDRYVPYCERILGITGPYWWENWSEGSLAHWLPKLRHLDMAIDLNLYPKVKQHFNPKGKRTFFYIGHSTPFKGVHLLSNLFGLAQGRHRCLWIGADKDMPHLQQRPFMRRMEGVALESLAAECDFFLTMGISDANPTTLLETMGWGFPVACTPQSGYDCHPEMLQLSPMDMRSNLALLDRLQNEDEALLLERSEAARALVARHYNWERFGSIVLDEIKPYIL